MKLTGANPPIGVIGFGDLGKKLSAQIFSTGYNVHVFDPHVAVDKHTELDIAVDLTTVVSLPGALLVETDASMILDHCPIVHWAVPSIKLAELPPVPDNCLVILHDSVMANSQNALGRRSDKDRFVFAHCLMNDAKRVLVATECGNYQSASKHLEAIGLAPKFVSVKQHDTLMARTQGVFAMIIKLGIKQELDHGYAAGDLTPSAIELREAVINREAKWTKQTLQSILSNPELKSFVDEMGTQLEVSDQP